MSVYKDGRSNELDFLFNQQGAGCFTVALKYADRICPYNLYCKESFIFIHGNTSYNPVDFAFKFDSYGQKNKFIQIFSKFCKLKKINFKIEEKNSMVRIESDFWTSNYVHLDLLACLLKEINRIDDITLNNIKTVKQLFSIPNLKYFSDERMKDLFLDVKNSIKKLQFSDLTNAQIYSNLFGFGGTNGLISYVKRHYTIDKK